MKWDKHIRFTDFIKSIVLSGLGLVCATWVFKKMMKITSLNPNIPTEDLAELDIRIIDNFISSDDANTLIRLAEDIGFNRSTTNIAGKGSNLIHEDRTSSSVTLPSEHILVKRIRNQVCRFLSSLSSPGVSNISENSIEPLQIVRYKFGEQYKPHYDASKTLPREHTILIYLNSCCDGGATAFPKLDREIVPKCGRALYFHNLRKDGSVNPLSLHAGNPILKEGVVKYACNIWIRRV